MIQRLSLALLVSLSVAACGGAGTESGGRVEYSVSAKQNYDLGIKKLEEEEWIDAAKYFDFVKSRFPYSKYAVLAELRLADTEFGAGDYVGAADAYKLYMKFHPTNEWVTNGYAAFRIGEAYYKQLPDDWFLVPPSYEKDQTAAQDATRALGDFLHDYPSSQFVEKAQKMYKDCAKRLADTEWYVAKYYWDRGHPMGTVLRLRTLLKKYPGVGYDEEALFLLGKAYVKVGRPDDARETFQTLLSRYPSSKRAGDAKRALESLPPPSAAHQG